MCSQCAREIYSTQNSLDEHTNAHPSTYVRTYIIVCKEHIVHMKLETFCGRKSPDTLIACSFSAAMSSGSGSVFIVAYAQKRFEMLCGLKQCANEIALEVSAESSSGLTDNSSVAKAHMKLEMF